MPTFEQLIRGFSKSPLPTMLALSALLIFGQWAWIRSEDQAKTRALEKAVVDKDLAQKEVSALIKNCADNLIESERRHKNETDSIYRASLSATNTALERMGRLTEKIKKLEKR